ncbi:MAG: acyltransferase [Gemmatimonadota bacterium]
MRLSSIVRRFFVPKVFVTLYLYSRHRCLVSPRAEVELSSTLSIGRSTKVGSFTKIKSADGPVSIGRDCSVATCCSLLTGAGGLRIGDDVMIGPSTTIVSTNLGYGRMDIPMRQQAQQSKGIAIGSNVWIGANCSILDGAKIGSGAVVAANSVVSGPVPENAVVSGNPAKVIFIRR